MIKSKQIIDEVELKLGKLIDNISEEDLNLIDSLNIHCFSINEKKEEFFVEDLLLFHNLKSLSFDHMSITDKIMKYVLNSNINRLDLFNCELLCGFNSSFDNINYLSIEYVDNFRDEYLDFFPSLNFLSYKGYQINYLPKNIRVLDINNSNVVNNNVFKESNVSEIYVSKEEYEKSSNLYQNFKTYVYDDNKCYLVGMGDKNE